MTRWARGLGETLGDVGTSLSNVGRPLPDFLIIGAQKGGTTSLHIYLSRHPDLSPSLGKKELHYFDRRRDGGLAWYRSHFERRRPFAATPLAFETTPRYLFHPEVPERIAAVLPDVRMIAVLRNPARRAVSAYNMEVARRKEELPMMAALLAEEERLARHQRQRHFDRPKLWNFAYKSRGHYAEQLERYYAHFDREQLLVLRSEDMFVDPHAAARQITAFLGVRDLPAGVRFPHKRPGHSRRSRRVATSPSVVPPEVEAYLAEYFAPHNERLEQLLGRQMWP